MHIIYKTLIVTSFVLSAYLVFCIEKLTLSLETAVNDTQKISLMQQQLEKQQGVLSQLQTELSAFHKEAKEVTDRLAKEDKQKQTLQALKNTLLKIDAAESLRKANNLTKAIESLLPIKETLWQAGEVFNSEQLVLRGFMPPIDALISKWKTGNNSADAISLQASIKGLIDKLSH